MSAAYVNGHYGTDFRRGDRVAFDGRLGRVVSFPAQYVGVRLAGDKHVSRCHPTWHLAKLHAEDWADDARPGDEPSCACGFNGTPEDCAKWRSLGDDEETP